jgi:hypothetical protein
LNEDNKELEFLANRILLGKYIFIYENKRYYQTIPTLDIKVSADFLYEQTYEENVFNDNFFSESYVKLILMKIESIPIDYDARYSKLEKQLEAIKIDLYKKFSNKSYRVKAKKEIDLIKNTMNKMYNSRHSLDYLLLDNFCNKIKNEFILSHTIYDDTNKLVFDYNNNLEFVSFNNMVQFIAYHNTITIDTIKKIARSNYWKNYWSASKNVLSNSACEWSDEQKALINISNMYDRINEHSECPDEEVIDDDDALDGWMLWQKKKSLQEKKIKGVDELLGSKGKNSSEVFLLANSNNEEIQEISELNDSESLQAYRSRINKTMSSDRAINEYEFADVQNKLRKELKERSKDGQ